MKLQKLIESFSNTKVLVAGDIMLDKYIFGRVTRISPEAPVQIVNVEKEDYRLGGAANVAKNIRSLGGNPTLYGVVGEDEYGKILSKELKSMGINSRIAICSDFQTICKVRVMARHQQLLRFDYEEVKKFSNELEAQLTRNLEEDVKEAGVALISDYNKGMFIGGVAQKIISLCNKYNKPVIVDPKPVNAKNFTQATLMCPNLSEAKQLIKREEEIAMLAERIIKKFGLEFVVITCGEDGLFVADKNGKSEKLEADAKEVYDVTGAGDTVAAVLGLCMANKAGIHESVLLANKAGGIVVGKVGTASVTQKELIESLK